MLANVSSPARGKVELNKHQLGGGFVVSDTLGVLWIPTWIAEFMKYFINYIIVV